MKIARPLLNRIHEMRFARSMAPGFRGVYADFETANRSAPKTKPLGFNCSEYAEEFQNRMSEIYSYDYPVLYWLSQVLQPDSTIFDFGGHIGVHYYSYGRFLQYGPSLRWTVCDLPLIIEKGRKLATGRQSAGLEFTSDFALADSADVLIAAGSLQYVEKPSFASSLSALKNKPRHLLLNKLPLYDGKQFVTLQNGIVAFHPQYVFNRREFTDSILDLGYELVDRWAIEARPGRVPFYPKHSFPFHSGLYFRLRD